MFRSNANRLSRSAVVALFAILAVAAFCCPRNTLAAPRISFSLDIDAGDYDYLSDYGEWVEYPPFGMVWHPFVVAGWEPFYHGQWSWTNDGWAWISYEPFGWLVYHYGYWYYRPMIGWFWVPGRVWSPARVQWYTYGDYCAWAPLPPPHYYWGDPWDYNRHNVWIVVNINHFHDEYIGRHRLDRPFRGMKIRSGTWRREAPAIRTVETILKRRIEPMKISRERVDLRPDTRREPTKYIRPRTNERKRMVLPEREASAVRQHRPEVERTVLVPREQAPRREQPRAPERQPTKKTEERQKRTIRRR
jgi:hypothetical protein